MWALVLLTWSRLLLGRSHFLTLGLLSQGKSGQELLWAFRPISMFLMWDHGHRSRSKSHSVTGTFELTTATMTVDDCDNDPMSLNRYHSGKLRFSKISLDFSCRFCVARATQSQQLKWRLLILCSTCYTKSTTSMWAFAQNLIKPVKRLTLGSK